MQRSKSEGKCQPYRESVSSSGGSSISSGFASGEAADHPHPPPQPPARLPGRTTATSERKAVAAFSPPPIVTVGGHTLIAPNSKLARAIVMGNEMSASESPLRIEGLLPRRGGSGPPQPPPPPPPRIGVPVSTATAAAIASTSSIRQNPQSRPLSNLTVLLNQHNHGLSSQHASSPLSERDTSVDSDRNRQAALPSSFSTAASASPLSSSPYRVDEADSASGPPPAPLVTSTRALGRSAPNVGRPRSASGAAALPVPPPPPPAAAAAAAQHQSSTVATSTDVVRRCMSSKELGGTLAPPSGSPYAYLLHKKEELQVSMRNRLVALREAETEACARGSENAEKAAVSSTSTSRKNSWDNENSTSSSSRSASNHESANELRNRRRAQHAQAVVDDLCNVVADLFIAESKLINPRTYGLHVPHEDSVSSSQSKTLEREQVTNTIHAFVSSLPLRYALSAETPSEVLLHMRLVAAVQSDPTKAVLHIHNLDDNGQWGGGASRSSAHVAVTGSQKGSLRLVTISCHDCTGLLEYISKLLASSGSRVLDADVMLSSNGIVLDRFVVEMTGRLRLDKMVNLVEAFLREGRERVAAQEGGALGTANVDATIAASTRNRASSVADVSGPLYVTTMHSPVLRMSHQEQEIKSGVPLSEVLASNSQANLSGLLVPPLRKLHSLPSGIPLSLERPQPRREQVEDEPSQEQQPQEAHNANASRERRPLINRRGMSDLDRPIDSFDDLSALDFVSVPVVESSMGALTESRDVPLIPFQELMLIETIGTGRVSTIYRAAWQRGHVEGHSPPMDLPPAVRMVALKVAMVNSMTGDTSHVDELRREADIAARLEHPNICDLVGVAVDPECFCLAYEYCEGGSLLSLLSDSTRYYEYLPIALDIVQGMAFLHKSSVIHRDLKPSNILLTRDHRAKIADFGMSVNNHGQELTAETGTYRYMAPEVIRHESYSSNADVYSFGICLWQLITREIPFATMTPIQAAYAVAEGHRPEIPPSTPQRLQEIIRACWDQDSHRRPSFTYIAMALADYAKMAFSPANVGTLTLQIANEMLATVEGNSTINVDFSTPVLAPPPPPLTLSTRHSQQLQPLQHPPPSLDYFSLDYSRNDSFSNLGLEIE